MRRFVIGLLALLLIGSGVRFAPTHADDQDELAKKRTKALAAGIEWLKKGQAADGSWDYVDAPFKLGLPHLKGGCTALCCYAMLKAGVEPKDASIEKGFAFMRTAPVDQIYSAGCILLALDARYNWEAPLIEQEEQGQGTHEKKKIAEPKKVKPPAVDLDLAQRCVDLIVKAQEPQGSWRYLQGGRPQPGAPVMRNDASHPQYALLGLDAAERLGIKVDTEVFLKSANYFLEGQEDDGPEVNPFPVPGADLSYKELKKIEKDMKDKIRKIEADFKGKKEGDVNGVGHTEADERGTVEREASDKIYKTNEKLPKMKSRGWPYMHEPKQDNGTTQGPKTAGGGPQEWQKKVTGSMTTSGLAALLVCKAQLDGTPVYEKSLKGPINKALRDAAAWIATNYSVDRNPGSNGHHYYYMYGLERGGMIGLIPKFGDHDWYKDGTAMFLRAQKGDGSWDAGMTGTSGPVPDTAFALLFLSKGTTPVVRIPNRTATGPGGQGK